MGALLASSATPEMRLVVTSDWAWAAGTRTTSARSARARPAHSCRTEIIEGVLLVESYGGLRVGPLVYTRALAPQGRKGAVTDPSPARYSAGSADESITCGARHGRHTW